MLQEPRQLRGEPRQRVPLARRGRSARRGNLPGFAAAEILWEGEAVKGVATGDLGVNRKGEKTDAYQAGMELHAKYTFFAEGCRGHLGRQLEEKLGLRKHPRCMASG